MKRSLLSRLDPSRSDVPFCTRRRFVSGLTLGAAALWTPGVFAEELTRTPAQTEGPFFPDRLPLDTDNDLLIVNDAITPAVGQITHLSGRVLDTNGRPLKNAVVEIWQVDGNGVYLHSGTANAEDRDKNFQGFGRFTTSSSGEQSTGAPGGDGGLPAGPGCPIGIAGGPLRHRAGPHARESVAWSKR